MSWSEIKKALNTDLNTPLNTLITNAKDSLASAIATVQSTVNTINTNAANANSNANTAKTNAANANTNAANANTNAANASAYAKNNTIAYSKNVYVFNDNQLTTGDRLSITGRGTLLMWLVSGSGSYIIMDGTTLHSSASGERFNTTYFSYSNAGSVSISDYVYNIATSEAYVYDFTRGIQFNSSLVLRNNRGVSITAIYMLG